MKAIEAYYNSTANGQDFRVVEQSSQPLGERDLRVQVRAISVNPVDFKVASRVKEDSPQPVVLGWDASGVVTEIGSKVKSFRVGDEVFYSGSVTRPGTNAQSHIVDERIVGKKPKTLSFKEAAAIPLTAVTAWESIFDLLKMPLEMPKNEKKSVLVIGAAGGVGSIAIQLLRNLTKAVVIGTASRAESQKWIRELGADHAIDHRADMSAQLAKLGHSEVDSILCFTDPDPYFSQFPVWLKPFGQVVSIVETWKPVDLAIFKPKSLTFSFEFMFTKAKYQTPDMDEQGKILNEVSRLIDEGKIRTTMALDLGEMSISNIKKAHELLRSGKAIGKIVMGELKG